MPEEAVVVVAARLDDHHGWNAPRFLSPLLFSILEFLCRHDQDDVDDDDDKEQVVIDGAILSSVVLVVQ